MTGSPDRIRARAARAMAESHSMREPAARSQAKDASRSATQSAPLMCGSSSMRLHRSILLRLLGTYGTIVVLVLMLAAFSIAEPARSRRSATSTISSTIWRSATIVAGGLTVPLVAGDFDLSIGYVASFCGLLLVGLLSFNQLPIPVAMLIVIAIGAVDRHRQRRDRLQDRRQRFHRDAWHRHRGRRAELRLFGRHSAAAHPLAANSPTSPSAGSGACRISC